MRCNNGCQIFTQQHSQPQTKHNHLQAHISLWKSSWWAIITANKQLNMLSIQNLNLEN